MDHALVIAAILDGLLVSVGKIIVDQIVEVAQERAKSLVYPSLISRLCYEAEVSFLPIDEENNLAKDILLLKKRGGRGDKKDKD